MGSCFGERFVLPKTLRGDMLKRLHTSHIGIEGCLHCARSCLYWPGTNGMVKDYIERCEVCRSGDNRQLKEPYTHMKFLTSPGQRSRWTGFNSTKGPISSPLTIILGSGRLIHLTAPPPLMSSESLKHSSPDMASRMFACTIIVLSLTVRNSEILQVNGSFN